MIKMRTMIVREEQVSSIAFLKAATPLLVVVVAARMTDHYKRHIAC